MKSVFRVLFLLALSIFTANLTALELKPSRALGVAPLTERILPKNPREAVAQEHASAHKFFAEGWCSEGQAALLRLRVLSAEHKLPAHDFASEQKQCAEYRMASIVVYMRLAYFTQDLSMVRNLAEEARRLALAGNINIPDDVLNMTKKMVLGYNQLLYIKIKAIPKPLISV